MNEDILELKRNYTVSEEAKTIVYKFVDNAYKSAIRLNIGVCLGATFDLLVSASYYEDVTNRGWTYCTHSFPMMFYTYTNICPRCIGHNEYVFAKANKPQSGHIGQITTEYLCLMYQAIFDRNGHNVNVYKASEPIDVIIFDATNSNTLLAEVKAAPLVTLPLATRCDNITENIDGEAIQCPHRTIDNAFLHNTKIGLFIPQYNDKKELFIPLDIHWDEQNCFLKAIYRLVFNDENFFSTYLDFWLESYKAYGEKNKNLSLFWLTNACGQPTPIPTGWPHKASGFESVSDSKTSAGMDRTDDIKKGIYQVLKLGADYKSTHENIKTAILSNLPAIRHFDEYLLTLKDIIWTISSKKHIKGINDLPPDTPIYNLFDGILSFTQCEIRDNWLKELFRY